MIEKLTILVLSRPRFIKLKTGCKIIFIAIKGLRLECSMDSEFIYLFCNNDKIICSLVDNNYVQVELFNIGTYTQYYAFIFIRLMLYYIIPTVGILIIYNFDLLVYL